MEYVYGEMKNMKFIIHNSDYYYPSVEEYDTFAEANKAFAILRESRMGCVANEKLPDFDTDYMAVVISEIDLKKIQGLYKTDIEMLDLYKEHYD